MELRPEETGKASSEVTVPGWTKTYLEAPVVPGASTHQCPVTVRLYPVSSSHARGALYNVATSIKLLHIAELMRDGPRRTEEGEGSVQIAQAPCS